VRKKGLGKLHKIMPSLALMTPTKTKRKKGVKKSWLASLAGAELPRDAPPDDDAVAGFSIQAMAGAGGVSSSRRTRGGGVDKETKEEVEKLKEEVAELKAKVAKAAKANVANRLRLGVRETKIINLKMAGNADRKAGDEFDAYFDQMMDGGSSKDDSSSDSGEDEEGKAKKKAKKKQKKEAKKAKAAAEKQRAAEAARNAKLKVPKSKQRWKEAEAEAAEAARPKEEEVPPHLLISAEELRAELESLTLGDLRKVRPRPGRLSGLGIFHCESVLYGAFVWARRALNSPKRRFAARAVGARRWRERRERVPLAAGRRRRGLGLPGRGGRAGQPRCAHGGQARGGAAARVRGLRGGLSWDISCLEKLLEAA
jgi:hypothetical protein